MTETPVTLPRLDNDLLLKAAWGMPIPRIPVWMMRQAGRTDPLYRELREQDPRPLEEIFLDVDQVVRVSLLPQRIGVDAIIVFQDILTPLSPIGAPFRFCPGPVLDTPIVSRSQVKSLRFLDPETDVPVVGKSLRNIQRELHGALPLLGFAGAPMTLAFFMIAGKSPGHQIPEILKFIRENTEMIDSLMDHLTVMTIDYLNYQIYNGAHAVQLFESFADVLPRDIYERHVQPTHQRIFAGLKPQAPGILFTKECSFVDLMLQSGARVMSVGSCVQLDQAMAQSQPEIVFQGNVDNRLLMEGTHEDIDAAIQQCFAQTQKKRHILNLNHGLLPQTPFENVTYFVEQAKKLGVVS
ncbi:MAG: uroporphyrinogen decarboxylase [SAR324 cluster bacterium]|nr:uroporphyrinogen decarboxylase [SAR324 cluster bacterium]